MRGHDADDRRCRRRHLAPDFTLDSQEGKPISLHDFKGKWVVLYFYPKDQTPGCTIEAHAFQRDRRSISEDNAVVVGVSVDTVESHKEWCAKDGMSFKMLSDADKKVSQIRLDHDHSPGAAARDHGRAQHLLIDPNGKIVKEFIKVNPTGHSRKCWRLADAEAPSSSPGASRGIYEGGRCFLGMACLISRDWTATKRDCAAGRI